MGLFSFGRKKLEDGFEFVIDGIYALKETAPWLRESLQGGV